jgi:hypothetical protein
MFFPFGSVGGSVIYSLDGVEGSVKLGGGEGQSSWGSLDFSGPSIFWRILGDRKEKLSTFQTWSKNSCRIVSRASETKKSWKLNSYVLSRFSPTVYTSYLFPSLPVGSHLTFWGDEAGGGNLSFFFFARSDFFQFQRLYWTQRNALGRTCGLQKLFFYVQKL